MSGGARRNPSAPWQAVVDLYEAVKKLSPTERRRALDEAAVENPALREPVEFLLSSSKSLEVFLRTRSRKKGLLSLVKRFSPLSPGDQLGDFSIEAVLGAGSFAEVYLARQRSLDRLVALKVSLIKANEGRKLAQLDHPHIVRVYSEEDFPDRGLHVLCMQYVAGTTLDRRIESARRDGGDSLDVLLTMGAQLAEALACAHERGVLHLDVKPANILVDVTGQVLLSDFNVSLDRRSREEGNTSSLGGTFGYMAPEQQELFSANEVRLDKLDGRTDIYSLGVVLKEWARATGADARGDRRSREAMALVAHCANPAPDRRFQSAASAAKAFRGALEVGAVTKALRPDASPLAWGMAHPVLMTLLFGIVPHHLTAFIGLHTTLEVFARLLNESQKQFLYKVNAVDNAFWSLVGAGVWIWMVSRFRAYFREPERHLAEPELVPALRGRALHLPFIGVALSSLLWFPSQLLNLSLLAAAEGPLPPEFVGFFCSCFILSWMITASFSFLCVAFASLRFLYPQLWIGAAGIRETARQELAPFRFRLALACLITPLTPLIAVVALLHLSPAHSPWDTRLLITVFAGLSAAGSLFAYWVRSQLGKAIAAFTGAQGL